jgi:hypothetical protein
MKRAMKAAAEALALEVGGRGPKACCSLPNSMYLTTSPAKTLETGSFSYTHQTHLSTTTLSTAFYSSILFH